MSKPDYKLYPYSLVSKDITIKGENGEKIYGRVNRLIDSIRYIYDVWLDEGGIKPFNLSETTFVMVRHSLQHPL